VARCGGGGGTASAMAAVGNNVPRDSRSAVAALCKGGRSTCGSDDGGGGDVVALAPEFKSLIESLMVSPTTTTHQVVEDRIDLTEGTLTLLHSAIQILMT
jgi:hypothetical protein